jgi:hypothetical protein
MRSASTSVRRELARVRGDVGRPRLDVRIEARAIAGKQRSRRFFVAGQIARDGRSSIIPE